MNAHLPRPTHRSLTRRIAQLTRSRQAPVGIDPIASPSEIALSQVRGVHHLQR